MSGTELDSGDLSARHHDAIHEIDARPDAPDGLPFPAGTGLLVKLVEWAEHGAFVSDEGHSVADLPGPRYGTDEDQPPGPWTFTRAMAACIGLLGRRVEMTVGIGGWEVLRTSAVLEAADDVGARERTRPGFHPSHDRLLVRFAGSGPGEGIWLDRRTFEGADDDAEGAVRLDLVKGVQITLTPTDAADGRP